jgi:ABC-type dipeptide/oligopeptide/nickel transport system ATPase subunit
VDLGGQVGVSAIAATQLMQLVRDLRVQVECLQGQRQQLSGGSLQRIQVAGVTARSMGRDRIALNQ